MAERKDPAAEVAVLPGTALHRGAQRKRVQDWLNVAVLPGTALHRGKAARAYYDEHPLSPSFRGRPFIEAPRTCSAPPR